MAKLIIVCGYVASGKTTVSTEVAQTMSIEIISTDNLRKELFPKEMDYNSIDLGKTEDTAKRIISWIKKNNPSEIDFQQVINPLSSFKSIAYKEITQKYASRIKEQKKIVYDEAFARLERCLAKGKDILFDATFSSKSMRERAYRIARKNGSNVYIVQISCDEDIVKSRLEIRKSGGQETTSNAKQLEIFRIVKNEFDESQIENDNPEGINIVRIVYDTGFQVIELFGKVDETARKIKDILINLSKKYS